MVGRLAKHDTGEIQKKYSRKRRLPASVSLSALKFGNWLFPPPEEDGSKGSPAGSYEVRVTFSGSGKEGKISYEFPFSFPAQPEANRALIEFSLSCITAVEVDEDCGSISFLLSSPPSTYLGRLKEVMLWRTFDQAVNILSKLVQQEQQLPSHQPQQAEGQQPSAQFDSVQCDFSNGAVKTHKAHMLFLGPPDLVLVRSLLRGGRSSKLAVASRLHRVGLVGGAAVRRMVQGLAQDEAVAGLIEQERQVEPGGCFASQEVEASLRPASAVQLDANAKPAKQRRKAKDDDDDDDGPPKKRRPYKPRVPKGTASAPGERGSRAAGASGRGEGRQAASAASSMQQALAASRSPLQVLELGLQPQAQVQVWQQQLLQQQQQQQQQAHLAAMLTQQVVAAAAAHQAAQQRQQAQPGAQLGGTAGEDSDEGNESGSDEAMGDQDAEHCLDLGAKSRP